MTRLLGPESSVFAAPHSGFAVWDKPIEGVTPGTIGWFHYFCLLLLGMCTLTCLRIGIVGSGYESIAEAVQATRKYGHSAIFDLGSDSRAGTRPWEVAEWLFSDDGTESMSSGSDCDHGWNIDSLLKQSCMSWVMAIPKVSHPVQATHRKVPLTGV